MSETRETFDPFEGKTVQIRNDLALRLRSQYACGPTLPSGEPEFGWRQFETPPIQHEAADEIERLCKVIERAGVSLDQGMSKAGVRDQLYAALTFKNGQSTTK